MFPQIFKLEPGFAPDLVVNVGGNADTAGLGYCFQSFCDIYSVTMDVFAVNDDVAEVDSDAKFKASTINLFFIALCHFLLNINGAFNRRQHIRKFGQESVTGVFDDATLVTFNAGINDFAAFLAPGEIGGILVVVHYRLVTSHVGCQDGC